MGLSGGIISNEVYQAGLIKLKEEIHELQRQRDELYRDVSLPDEIKRLNKKKSELTKQTRELELSISSAIANQKKIVADGVREATKSIVDKPKKLQAKIAGLEHRIKEGNAEVDRLTEVQKVIDGLIDAQNEHMKSEEQAFNAKIARGEDRLKKRAAELLDRKREFNILLERHAEIERQYKSDRGELNRDIKTHAETITANKKWFKSEEDRLSKMEAKFKADKDRNDKSITDMKAKLATKNKELVDRAEKLDTWDKSLKFKMKDLDAKWAEVLKREADLATNWEMYSKEKQKLDIQIKRMK